MNGIESQAVRRAACLVRHEKHRGRIRDLSSAAGESEGHLSDTKVFDPPVGCANCYSCAACGQMLGEDVTALRAEVARLTEENTRVLAGWKQTALELDGYEGGVPQMGTRLWRAERELSKARGDNARLRAALEPFAKFGRDWISVREEDESPAVPTQMKVKHFRAAVAALQDSAPVGPERRQGVDTAEAPHATAPVGHADGTVTDRSAPIDGLDRVPTSRREPVIVQLPSTIGMVVDQVRRERVDTVQAKLDAGLCGPSTNVETQEIDGIISHRTSGTVTVRTCPTQPQLTAADTVMEGSTGVFVAPDPRDDVIEAAREVVRITADAEKVPREINVDTLVAAIGVVRSRLAPALARLDGGK